MSWGCLLDWEGLCENTTQGILLVWLEVVNPKVHSEGFSDTKYRADILLGCLHLESGDRPPRSGPERLEQEVNKRFDKVDAELKALGNRMYSKFNRMMYFFLGALVLKGGFDFFIQERGEQKFNVAHKQ